MLRPQTAMIKCFGVDKTHATIRGFGVDKTNDDGHLRPKHVVSRRNKSENNFIKD
jgi:hypothetical protein